eukprot:gene912-5232_t
MATYTDLRWQRDLLLDAAQRLVIGCEETLWPHAFPAAIAVVKALEGKDPRASGYHRLMTEVLSEGERGAHKRERRLVFFAAASELVDCLGLTTLRHMGRLMLLTLEGLQAYDVASRAAALD